MPEYDLTIEVRTHPVGATVVVLAGELDYHTAPRLHRAVERTAESLPLVLDLALLRFCDSLGVAELLFAFRRTREAGTSLALVGTGADVGRLLTMTGVDRLLPRHDTVDAAVGALRPDG
ncbi:STAS domain-containing protein [Kitasatospora cineracea]|uniref:Anti-sigma factor antagonist n=1 Tax=Kitasatospora cineracea TaxID=88074 RepID=A0A8G1ULS7_9ACTN|nr:STAS domain-containing protein [Kitasatospora cineracea]ROR46291.1 anti-sigma B factor antagonist [Kitasatospora cineracea]